MVKNTGTCNQRSDKNVPETAKGTGCEMLVLWICLCIHAISLRTTLYHEF